jgi:hypothetical protein
MRLKYQRKGKWVLQLSPPIFCSQSGRVRRRSFTTSDPLVEESLLWSCIFLFSEFLLYFLLFYFLLFIHLFICAYIVWAISPPCPLSPSFSPTLLTSRQNLFCLLLQCCWRENIRDNKKVIALLLAWIKDNYIERFLELLPCTCVLQPELVHLYQTSTLFPSHLPIVLLSV